VNDTFPTSGSPANYVAPAAASAMRRQQASTVVYGILCIVLIIVILQLWLLTATMNAYLGGDESVIWPAAGVSVVCLLLNLGLLRYVYGLDHQ
jgi:hypothetical protein